MTPNRPAQFNSYMLRACSILWWKPQKGRGKTTSPSLPAAGQPYRPAPQSLWGSGDPLPSAPGKCALLYSTKHPPKYLLLNMNLPHQLLILLPQWPLGLGPIQMATPLPWPDFIPTSIGSHLKSGLWGATALKEKGWNASSQNINRESVGSLCQGFGLSTEGKGGTLQDKLPKFLS